jgi:hypothetical protein
VDLHEKQLVVTPVSFHEPSGDVVIVGKKHVIGAGRNEPEATLTGLGYAALATRAGLAPAGRGVHTKQLKVLGLLEIRNHRESPGFQIRIERSEPVCLGAAIRRLGEAGVAS